MWPFTKKRTTGKRRRHLLVPEIFEQEGYACVYRREPRRFNGVELPRSVGSFYGLPHVSELVERVARVAGGRAFTGKLWCERDITVEGYMGTYHFRIAGDPLIDGEEVPEE